MKVKTTKGPHRIIVAQVVGAVTLDADETEECLESTNIKTYYVNDPPLDRLTILMIWYRSGFKELLVFCNEDHRDKFYQFLKIDAKL